MKIEKGFTLIELLIVIVIIGILAGVVLSVLNPARAQRKANETVHRANMEKICLALQSCGATTTTAANCNTLAKMGATAPTTPSTATYVVSGAVTVTGTLPAGVGSTTSCVYTCGYTFSTSTPVALSAGTGCLID